MPDEDIKIQTAFNKLMMYLSKIENEQERISKASEILGSMYKDEYIQECIEFWREKRID